MRPSLALCSAAVLTITVFVFAPKRAWASDDCPPGSSHKTADTFGWCEPTVCETDGQCDPGEVCRPVGLCMEVGRLADAGSDAGAKRLVVTQRCAPDKTCPQAQTCSDLGRCLSKTTAEKMGILAASTASAPPASGEAKKSSCGCDVVGRRSHSETAMAAMGIGVALLARRRQRRGTNVTLGT